MRLKRMGYKWIELEIRGSQSLSLSIFDPGYKDVAVIEAVKKYKIAHHGLLNLSLVQKD
ncbi:MAG: hypothetical protein M8353_02455 [ANME-2 cluster archaeon]|nr:hypothetical protein [ANME-2 cluster archaeon]